MRMHSALSVLAASPPWVLLAHNLPAAAAGKWATLA